MLRLYLIIIFILTGLGGYSQLTGIIISTENQEPLIGANVYWRVQLLEQPPMLKESFHWPTLSFQLNW